MPTDYTVSYEIIGTTTTVTNSYSPEETSLGVTKVWVDNANQDRKRPTELTVNLTKKLEGSDTVTNVGEPLHLTADNNWSGIFENLPKKEDGKTIIYGITEDAVTGYTTSITGNTTNGFTITNTHET